jgi:hypothetical protein
MTVTDTVKEGGGGGVDLPSGAALARVGEKGFTPFVFA